jgi:hypothetical protein
MRTEHVLALGALIVTFAASKPTAAATLTVTGTNVMTISDGLGNNRVLLDVRGLSKLQGEWVTEATLTVAFAGAALTSDLDLSLDLVATDWSAGASWSTPWTKPGGDRLGLEDAQIVVPAGTRAQTLSFDVTDMVRAVVDGDAGDNGFILYPTDPGKPGLDSSELSSLGSVTKAALTVEYRSLKALGYRDGARALMDRKRTSRAAPEGGHP